MNDFFVSLMLLGAMGGDGSLPFWTTANTFGLMPNGAGASALFSVGANYGKADSFHGNWNVSLAFSADNANVALFPGELYVDLSWKCLSLDLGIKHRKQQFMASDPILGTLSTTAGYYAWSGNSRSLPGYLITLHPVEIPFTKGHLQLSGTFGDYIMTDPTRYVSQPWIHSMSLYLKVLFTSRFSMKLGLDHWAMWRGIHPEEGVLPHSFCDYLRVITGQGGGSSASLGERMNVLGNHLGALLIRFDYDADKWSLTAQHDHPYDDKSGMKFRNFPDGVNTFSISFKDKDRWVSDIVYEFQYTMNQSGRYERRPATEAEIASKDPRLFYDEYQRIWMLIEGGNDNYFNNYGYKSGWTNYRMTIGDPLLTPSASPGYGIMNNKVIAHHIGVSGKLARVVPYSFLLTYSLNHGTNDAPFPSALRQLSGGLKLLSPALIGRLQFLGGVFFDRGDLLGNRFAATLGLKINFIQ